MRDNPYRGKPNTKRSVRYQDMGKTTTSPMPSSLYLHMFREDLRLGLMPIAGKSLKPDFSVELEPASKEVAALLVSALRGRHSFRSSLAETVCGFMNEAATVLASYAEAYYEVVYFFTDSDCSKIEGFEIARIFNQNIKSALGFFWQSLPKDILDERRDPAKRFIWLPKDTLLTLSIPRALGGRRKFKRLLSDLEWLGQATIPKFAMADMAARRSTRGYDFSTYRERQEILLARRTRDTGWTARGTFAGRSLEFYQMYRSLRFAKTKAIIREYIFAKLNECLTRVGGKMGFQMTIKFTGIPSVKDYNNYIAKLMDGSLQFSEVVELLRL